MTRDEMMDALSQVRGFIECRTKMAGIGDGMMLLASWGKALDMTIDELKAQKPRVTCSTCKHSRCLSGEWFCFMIGTSRYGKRVTDGDWYCKDAEGR